MPRTAPWLALVVATLLIGVAGCQSGPLKRYAADTVEPYRPTNYQAVDRIPKDVRRVVVLPVSHAVADADYLPAFDQTLMAELGQTTRFELVSATRDDLRKRWGRGQFDSASALPADLMEVLKREYAAEAVLFCDLTIYQPTAPIRIGWRLKLVTFDDQQMLWAFDEVFDAGRPEMARAAKENAAGAPTKDFPLDRRAAAVLSPSAFARYGLKAAFDTLPRR